jgi:Secretion system C-terminal sorting domain
LDCFSNFALVGDKLYFGAHDPAYGIELWYLPTGIIATQTINFPSITNKVYGSPSFKLKATASSGLPVTYTSLNTAVAIVVGDSITIVGAGTADIVASQVGNNIYSAATPVVRTLTVTKAPQTITFNPLGTIKYEGNKLILNATSSTNLPIVYLISNPNIATVSGNELTMLSAGSVNITASQPGNNNYFEAANIMQNLIITKGDQTIMFEDVMNKIFGDAPFNLPATTSAGLPITYLSSNNAVVTIAGNVVTIAGAGISTVRGSQAGNALYNPAVELPRFIVIGKAPQTITFPAIADKLPNAAPFALNATSNAGLPISYTIATTPANNVASLSGNIVTILGEGSVTITASQIGSTNYNPAPNVTRKFNVSLLTNIQSNLPASSLTVYPNPSEKGIFTIKGIQNVDRLKVTYQLFDGLGRVVQSGTWEGKDIEKLELTKQRNGVYILLLKGANTQISKKLIKQN